MVIAARGRTWPLYVAAGAGLYALACLLLYVGVRRVTGGHVLFALDDPYIHLALSEQIAAGHYGINPGEAASPSSSIVWPFLLAVFAKVSWQPTAALGMNLTAGLAAAAMLGYAVAEWPGDDGSWTERVKRLLSVVGLGLIGNLLGLTFVGMEHTLEVMLTIVCALGLTAALRGRALPWWAMVAAVLAPMVRYECLTLTVAVALCLVGERRWKQAVVVAGAAAAPLLAFSVFLRHEGLPLLPVSVLFKGGVSVGSVTARQRLEHEWMMVRGIFAGNWQERVPLLLLCLMLLELGLGQKERVRRFTLLGAAALGLMYLVLGPFGWFHRYEVYMVLFCAMLVLAMVAERPKLLLSMYVALLVAASYPSLEVTAKIVPAAEDIYLQQYQMHRFVTEFATGNVAVSDLGMVSYRRRPGQTVLDLLGLGSVEVARQSYRTPAWLDAVTRKHDVKLVMIYQAPWLYPNLPADWKRLGRVCKQTYVVTVADPCVSYFATPLADAALLQSEFDAFAKTLPAGVSVWAGTP